MAISSMGLGLGLGLLLFALSWVAWRTLNWVWLRPKRLERLLRQQGLKGNPYRSLSGDHPETTRMLGEAVSKPIGIFDDIVPRILPFFHEQIVNTYGKDSFSWDGPLPRLNVLHPEHIKEVFNRMFEFQKPTGANPLAKKLATGVFSHEGQKWAMHRKIINPAFTMEKIKLMLPSFISCCNEMVTIWDTVLSGKESVEINVFADIQNMTRDVISKTSFGSSYEEGQRIFELQTEMGVLVLKSMQSVYIPGWRFFPTNMNRKMKNINEEVETLLRGIIGNKEKAIREGKVASDDLLGILLESNMKEIREQKPKNKKNAGLSIQDIIEECKLFYIAGQETTSTLLTWTMFLLSVYPSWQDRARDEVLQVFGRDQRPDNIEKLNHLKIVTMILYEVLRLYPPIPALTRQVNVETKLGKLTIPTGTQLLLPTILVHHDKELWGEDAKEFKPERFSEGIAKATKNQVSFFPFGGGQRICVGQNFALLEAKLAMAMILQRFSFDLSPSYTHAPMSFLTLQPQYGLQLILQSRS